MSQESHLGVGERIGLAAFVGGLGGTLAAMALPFAYPDLPVRLWQLIFWPSFAVLVGSSTYVIFDLLVRPRHLRKSGVPKKLSLKIVFSACAGLLIGGILLLLIWDISSSRFESPSRGSPPVKLQSTYGKAIFRCARVVHDDRTIDQVRADMKERMEAAQGTFGINIEVSDIPGGRKIVVKPITDEGRIRMEGVRSWTMEMRRSGSEVLVTSIFEFPEPLGTLFNLMRIDPTSQHAKSEHEQLEQMIGVPKGACQMI